MSHVDTSLFRPELVFFDFEAADRGEFFEKLGVLLDAQGYIKDTWLAAVTERERNYPTGLACEAINVAIPHTEPEHLNRPYIAIVRPKEPIEFEGMGGIGGAVPAELIINLGLEAHNNAQVAVLQALMGVFMDKDAVSDVLAQTTPEGMVATMVRLCG